MRSYESGWRQRNPEAARNRYRNYLKRYPNREKQRWNEYDAANREKRRDAIAKSRAENPEHHRELRTRWRDENLEAARAQCRAYWHRRRSGADPSPTTDAYAEWLLLQSCFYCGASGRMTIDHVVPLARGGKHEADNLVPACQSCNSSKGAKLLEEWDGWKTT